MITMTLAEIATATGGTVDGDPHLEVTAPASQDSRTVEPGGLYVAIVGERADGHDFATQAVQGGAAAVLGTRVTGVPTVVVDDPVVALGRLARHLLTRLPDVTVLALTGSQGKTGTKDYLAQVLARSGETVATAGNNNNELGVPLTVLRATADTRFLVVEMGARGVGHIAYLCSIAPPDVAAVVNVGRAHLGEFGSREAIAQAKGEIIEALGADGVAVLNGDDALTAAMAERTAARVVRFGTTPGCEVTWADARRDDLGRPGATFGIGAETGWVQLRQIGDHQLANAAAAAAMATAAGLAPDQVREGLAEAVSLSRWRMETTEVPGGPVVINDAYNANPDSMRAAVATLASIGAARGSRTVAVLGEMLELGEATEAEHRALGEAVVAAGIDVLVVVGAEDGGAAPIAAGAERVTSDHTLVVSAPDRDLALAWLRHNVGAGDVVLVKASRGPALETIADGLVAAARPGPGAEEPQA
ncbi:UDP-N-acetylmuramoyl-tripeptide--D-alanyl-D-alanine ligase [Nocardioides sp. AE5]|uniref:UDP-N-acetylmuramoyl-tripeptide--D-alanyl-D- alanine ligase n=1 Tax=Nocardioides sp. AE5 TaxID=2962573 RepID=UPI002881DB01|nr:UDP-N-acetylmuramoyl-tripeptide--D-alanyl-D-alanine ligase [Nocardioides sp. AE5]MDT0201253.1 UDP-N-acetylmuramoyl-tripeptide--D-alanyl-D-alanine ligase [Nocardioides sp. AE5]